MPQPMHSEKYHEMYLKVQQGKISEDTWREFCNQLLEQILEKNKDVLIRLKNR